MVPYEQFPPIEDNGADSCPAQILLMALFIAICAVLY